MGSAASLQQDTGLIPGPAWWVKALTLPQLGGRSQLWLQSDPWPGSLHMPGAGGEGGKKRNVRVPIGAVALVPAWQQATGTR